MIKLNDTPFKGRLYLAFQKFPHYSSSRDFLAKVLLDLGWFKIVTRIKPTGYSNKALKKAYKSFHRVSVLLVKNYFTKEEFLSLGKSKVEKYNTLYCYNYKGDFLGSLEDLYWLCREGYIVDLELKGVAFNNELKNYVGFSHRAAQVFKIGDMLYTEDAHAKLYEKSTKLGESTLYKDIGEKRIETLEEARQAAYNFSRSVS